MTGAKVRGQPLVALLAILGGWAGGRAVAWEPPAFVEGAAANEMGRLPLLGAMGFAFDDKVGPQSLPASVMEDPTVERMSGNAVGPFPSYRRLYPAGRLAAEMRVARPTAGFPLWNPAGDAWGPSARDFAPSSAGLLQAPAFTVGVSEAGFPGSFRLPPLASLSAQPAPPATAGPSPTAPGMVPVLGPRSKRWSGDSWVLMRRGGGGVLAAGTLPATYGASQAGTVLRYRLATRDDRRPTAYLRVASSLGRVQETSAALGLSARPLSKVPIVAALEARITEQAGRRRLQPVAMAVTEIAPFELPIGMRSEVYAQAGYVGGEFATPFFDGQFRFDRPLLSYAGLDARLGAGAWGGAQRGAGRLDFGPTATVTVPLGRRIFGRMALDWRFRVLGNAEPQSGPAVTLSAGF